MALADRNITESPIFKNSIEGLQAMLGRVAADYGKPSILVVPSDYYQRELDKQNSNWQYPIMTLMLMQLSKDTTSYNNNLRRMGVSVADNDKILTYRLLPVQASFRVRYITQDYGELIKFSSRWVNRQQNVQFKLKNDKLTVNIRVILSDDLSVPQQDLSDIGNLFQLETSCTINTYLGEIETNSRIKQVNLSTNLISNVDSSNPTAKTLLSKRVINTSK